MPKGILLEDWTPQLILKQGLSTDCSSRRKHDSDDEAVKGEGFGEDHHEDEGDQDISLGVSTDTSITNDTNAETSSEGGETAAEASAEGLVSLEVRVRPVIGGLQRLCRVRDLLDY